jgi:hypothetical protein
MLSFLPSFYEDELLYSWFARYHIRSCNMSPKATMNDLFGTPSILAVPDLPTHLNEVYERTKHFDPPHVNEWIEQHTFYHYYTTFAKQDVKKKVYETMYDGKVRGSLHMITGVMASSITEYPYFRYCPYCAKEEMERYGENYWHLSHQLPSVLMCPKHETLLIASYVPFRGANKHTYTAAMSSLLPSHSKTPVYTQKTMKHLVHLANESMKMIQNRYRFTWEGIQKAYKYFLQKKRYATVNGKVDQQTLAEQFQHFYGEELLTLMQSPINAESESCWLKAITRKHRKVFHPIRHLLFISFLGETVDSFYQFASETYQPFGKGPYLCLNAAADHYLKPVIPTVKVTICTDTRRPVGTFACSCGFIYSRRGPDQTEDDLFKIGRIKQFGPVWQDKLSHLLHVDKLSYYATAKRLNVDIGTVKKYAKIKTKEISSFTETTHLLEEKQIRWLQLCKNNSNSTTTELRKLEPALYAWLYRHDKQWLHTHSPKTKRIQTTNNRVDWDERDRKLLKH